MKKIKKQIAFWINGLLLELSKKSFFRIYMPCWLVLFTDMILVLSSYMILQFIYGTISGDVIFTPLGNAMYFSMGIYLIMELTFGIYKGIVRYSGINELGRLLAYVGSSSLILIIINELFRTLNLNTPFPGGTSVILLGGIAFIMLFISRIGVKYLFYFIQLATTSQMRVIIYGNDVKSLAIAQSMELDKEMRYKPVCLLNTLKSSSPMRIDSIPVYSMPQTEEEMFVLMDKVNCNHLVFHEEHLKKIPAEQLDLFLDTKMHLLVKGGVSDLKGHRYKERISVNEIKIEDLLERDVIHTSSPEVENSHRDAVVLITGAAGSIGSEVVMQVAAFKPKLIVLFDNAETPLYNIELKVNNVFPDAKVIIMIGDVRNKERLEYAFDKFRPEIVYHAAAYKHVPMMERYPSEAVRVNVMGTCNVADMAVKYNSQKFVMISTDKAVNPTNVMGATKRIAEIYVQSLNLWLHQFPLEKQRRPHFITTRFGNVLGSNGSVVPLFKEQISKGGPVTVTHKDIIRYFMTIPEACRLVMEAGCMGKGGEIFVFDMGAPVRIYDLAKRMICLTGLTPNKDINIIETGLRPGEKLYEELLNDKEKTLPTYHEKIKVAKVRNYDYDEVKSALKELINLALAAKDYDVVRCMKEIVPEFKSKNSIYENLDKEIRQIKLLSEKEPLKEAI